jgi:hypothetical protein
MDLKGAWEEIGKKQGVPVQVQPEKSQKIASTSYGQI